MQYIQKIRGELRPVNTQFTFVVREDATRYSTGTSIPPEEAHAREIAQQALARLRHRADADAFRYRHAESVRRRLL